MRRIRDFLRQDSGTSILEFGILAPVFFLLLVALIDLSLFFATRAIVDDSVENAARAVRLGELQASADPDAAFRGALCDRIFFLECDRFSYTVTASDRLASSSISPVLDDDGLLVGATIDLGEPEDIVVITISYVHRFIIPWMGDIFGDDGLNDPQSRAIISFLVVKNEPFPDN